MQRIEEMSDADISEVRESAELFLEVEAATSDLNSVLNILTGLRWLTTGMKVKDRKATEATESPLVEALSQQPQDAFSILAGRAVSAHDVAEDEPVPLSLSVD